MKLLDKKEIAVQKSTERKRDVEEGVKLAKSIDTLRETHSKEQQGLKRFRDDTLALIKKEIGSYTFERDQLLLEVKQLKEERLKAQAPIDLTNEWKEVESLKSDLLQRETKVINREILVQDLDNREREIEKRDKESQLYFDSSRETYTKTEAILRDIEKRNKESEVFVKGKKEELEVKEKDLIEREFVASRQVEQANKDKNENLLKTSSLIERETKLEVEKKELEGQKLEIHQTEQLTKRFNDEAAKNHSQSETIKLEAIKFKEDVEKEINNKTLALQEREKTIGYRERDLALEREQLESEKKQIEREKIHVASQQETLRQAWNNIKKLKK